MMTYFLIPDQHLESLVIIRVTWRYHALDVGLLFQRTQQVPCGRIIQIEIAPANMPDRFKLVVFDFLN